jgi:hypothetical protein
LATLQRTFRRAATWRPKRSGTDMIDIATLISPLRYDVLVRAQFFGMLASRPAGEPIEELVDAALGAPYAVWFRHIAMARYRPWVLKDDQLFREQFTERVVTAKALYESVTASGFDPRHPVTLRGTTGPLRSDSGALIHRRVHVGDGGHRLAILLSLGQPLEPGMYVIDPRPMPVIDNTGILAAHLGLVEAEYAEFLARGYGDHRAASSLAELGTMAAGWSAEERAELDEVLAAHERTRARLLGPGR